MSFWAPIVMGNLQVDAGTAAQQIKNMIMHGISNTKGSD